MKMTRLFEFLCLICLTSYSYSVEIGRTASKINRISVANFFSSLSGEPCSELLTVKSQYKLEPVGLPDILKWGDNYTTSTIQSDSSRKMSCTVKSIASLITKASNQLHADNSNIKIEEPKKYIYKLFSNSLKFQDTTFSWRLVYTDSNGNRDTLKLTTELNTDENTPPKRCYDFGSGDYNSSQILNKSVKSTSKSKTATLYRILDFSGDTTTWLSSDCKIHGKYFKCSRQLYKDKLRSDECGPTLYRINSVTDAKITYKDINFGKNAMTDYIPVANIQEFNRDSVARLFSRLPSKPCSELIEFRSNYQLESIGLPDDFTWQNQFPKAVLSNDLTGTPNCSIKQRNAQKRPDPYKLYKSHIFEELPEKASVFNYQLFNKSVRAYQDTTISWKLIYRDQYGRGDTLNITTLFE